MSAPRTVFISYSHNDNDRPLLDQLRRHLAPLVQGGNITLWDDAQIIPGALWDQTIRRQLEQTDIVVFLVSSDYTASDYINRVEVPIAMERQAAGLCVVVPVLLRSCMFDLMPYSQYEFLPKTPGDQRLIPVANWERPDEALAVVARRLATLTSAGHQNRENPPTGSAPPSALTDLERQGREEQLRLAILKLQRLQTARLLETDPARQFALDHDIANLETVVANLKP